MQERENMIDLDWAIETIMRMPSRFNEKDDSWYLEAYKAEMLMKDIPEAKQLSGFARVVMMSLHGEILEMIAENHDWVEMIVENHA